MQRFQNEAKAAASLQHEHIVPVYGVGCERGVHYYAMQFIDGHDAGGRDRGASRRRQPPAASDPTRDSDDSDRRPRLAGATPPPSPPCPRGRTWPPAELHSAAAAELIADAADALEYAHSMGIVHRDVKPGNLMLDAAGKLWVADFGLARFGPDAGLTMTGDLLGTLRYMAPEQALARHGLADHRVDVYGLGCTLYELLTGQPAVGGDGQGGDPAAHRVRGAGRAAEAGQGDPGGVGDDRAEVPGEEAEWSGTRRPANWRRTCGGFSRTSRSRRSRRGCGQRVAKWARRHVYLIRSALAIMAVDLGL